MRNYLIVIILIIVLAIIGVFIYQSQNQIVVDDQPPLVNQESNTNDYQSNSDQDVVVLDKNEEKTDITADWLTFTDPLTNIKIKYPQGWKEITLLAGQNYGFVPDNDNASDFQWGILVSDPNKFSKQKLIDQMGSQFADRKVETENITINGLPAQLVTVTTNTNKDWFFQQVFIEGKTGEIYGITNGAVKDDLFESFYKSFEFIRK